MTVTAVVLSLLGSCSVPPRSPEYRGRALTLPAVPVRPLAGVVFDPAHLDLDACTRCASLAGRLGVEEFLYGDVAVDAVRRLAAVARPAAAERAVLTGDLVVSGYHGGRWLADGLDTIGARSPLDPVARDLALALGDGFLSSFAALSADGASAAGRADPEEAAGLVAVLAAVYGYNRGYLELALERPPAGSVAPTDAVECAGPTSLRCTSTRFPLGAADRWPDVDAELATGDGRWSEARRLLDGLVPASLEGGRQVWERLLAGAGFADAGYRPLVDTSAGFLAIAGLALRAALTGWAERDPDATRVAFDLTAGLVAWAGSYFVGLAAPPGDPLPTLDCPADPRP